MRFFVWLLFFFAIVLIQFLLSRGDKKRFTILWIVLEQLTKVSLVFDYGISYLLKRKVRLFSEIFIRFQNACTPKEIAENTMWNKFTTDLIKVIHFAQEEVKAQQRAAVDTHHLLFGLIMVTESLGWQVLQKHGVTFDACAEFIRQQDQLEKTTNPFAPMSVSLASKHILIRALLESETLPSPFAGEGKLDTEHLLLALFHQPKSHNRAKDILGALQLDYDEVRKSIQNAYRKHG